jgi:hypothetical protein
MGVAVVARLRQIKVRRVAAVAVPKLANLANAYLSAMLKAFDSASP